MKTTNFFGRRLYAVALTLFLIGFQQTVFAAEWSWTASVTGFSKGDNTLNEVKWNASIACDAQSTGVKGEKNCPQIAKSNALTLYTEGISGTIKSVKIQTWCSNARTVTLKVGDKYEDKTGKSTAALHDNKNDYLEWTNINASGRITLTWSSTNKACYVRSITVTYEEGGSGSGEGGGEDNGDCGWLESFSKAEGTGGNDKDGWNGNIAQKEFTSDKGWTQTNGNAANGCAKFGTSKAGGSATTPALTGLLGDLTVNFKAAAWNASSENTTLSLSSTKGTISASSVTLKKGAWTEYTVTISGVKEATQITFSTSAKNSRFFLDEICVTAAPACETSVTLGDITIKDNVGGTAEWQTTSPFTTCEETTAVLRITPTKGYQLKSITTSGVTASGPAPTVSAVTSQTDFTYTFAKASNGTLTATVEFEPRPATAWTWKYNANPIPDLITLYVGQVAELDVTFTPDAANLLSKQKDYTVTKSDPIKEKAKAGAYYKFYGNAAIENTSFTISHDAGILTTQTVNVRVLALPVDHFVDMIHGVVFEDHKATVDGATVQLEYALPSTPDYTGATSNTCAAEHLHLVGWIDADWATEHMSATHNDIVNSGKFYTVGQSVTAANKTYFAVWATENK